MVSSLRQKRRFHSRNEVLMKIGVPKETAAGERRVSQTPETCARLKKAGIDVLVQIGAGVESTFLDKDYEAAGARLTPSAVSLFGEADLITKVQPPSSEELKYLRQGQILVGHLQPLTRSDLIRELAQRGVTALAMELMPRITRAQKLDTLSSQTTVSGYKAVLLAAAELPRFFPMLMTAAGTIPPARVLILGAGVAGLQAIATAKRLGALVEAFDVRPAVKEQVESLGAKFVVVEAPAEQAQDAGGYAKEMSEAYKAKQAEAIARHVKESDVVISTALIPGKPAPKLITADMVRAMKPNTVIVDLAAEAGGNCELTRPDQKVEDSGVIILGPTNLPSSVPCHASAMYARNVQALLLDLWKNNELKLDTADEVVAGVLVCRNGEIVNPRLKQ